jgi:hypothetical protein
LSPEQIMPPDIALFFELFLVGCFAVGVIGAWLRIIGFLSGGAIVVALAGVILYFSDDIFFRSSGTGGSDPTTVMTSFLVVVIYVLPLVAGFVVFAMGWFTGWLIRLVLSTAPAFGPKQDTAAVPVARLDAVRREEIGEP